MKLKYETSVVSVGPMAIEFAAEGILVFFGEDAPEELHEFAIIHEHRPSSDDVVVGDVVEIAGVSFAVTGVGEIANENLRTLGHLVVKFNGFEETELPGEVSLAVGDVPEIGPGTQIKIFGRG